MRVITTSSIIKKKEKKKEANCNLIQKLCAVTNTLKSILRVCFGSDETHSLLEFLTYFFYYS